MKVIMLSLDWHGARFLPLLGDRSSYHRHVLPASGRMFRKQPNTTTKETFYLAALIISVTSATSAAQLRVGRMQKWRLKVAKAMVAQSEGGARRSSFGKAVGKYAANFSRSSQCSVKGSKAWCLLLASLFPLPQHLSHFPP